MITKILLPLLGSAFLFIRYRDSQKVRKILVDEYEDSYTQAGIILILWIIALFALSSIATLFLVIIYDYLRDNLHLF